MLTNKERQARWRKKNGVRYNLERRNARKGIFKNPVQVAEPIDGASVAHAIPEGRTAGSNPATGAKQSKIEALRNLITKEHERVVETPVCAPTVFKDDYGRIISEAQWKCLQEKKERAKSGGYVLDDYSQ